MQLLKKRDFSAFFSDTFSFFSANFKHLATTFMYVVGPLLALELISLYFYFKTIFNTVSSFGSESASQIESQGFSEVIDLFFIDTGLAIVIIAFILITIVLSVVMACFIPFYMKLYLEKGPKNFNHEDIWSCYRSHIKRIIYLILVLILISIPAAIIIGIAAFISMITIVGIFVVFGFIHSYFQVLWFHHLDNKEHSPFDSLSETFKHYKGNFWAIIGATILMLFIYVMVSSIISIFGALFTVGFSFLDVQPQDPEAMLESYQSIPYFIFQAFHQIVMFFAALVLQIQQGLVYYSSKESQHNIFLNEEIEQIGQLDD